MRGRLVPDNIVENTESAPRGGFGSELFWRLLATVIFISVLWILWLLWQITPRPTVNPIVFQIQQIRQSASGLIHRTPTEGQAADAPQSTRSGQDAVPPSALSTGAPLDNLKIETELKAPPKPAASAAK